MKIKKSLFKTEIEFNPDELRQIMDCDIYNQAFGLMLWIKKVFRLDIIPRPKK